ncbi:MAG: phosphatidylglycerophosphatase [Actinomycetota bacterium]|nr:phosphatidylglycerophosphatase [Actinomycetota bacterium]
MKVAAFDFDGTLTRSDTLGPFLREVCGTVPFVRALAADAPRLALAGIGAGSRDAAKERMLRRLLGGREHAELVVRGRAFAERVATTGMRPETVARLEWHAHEGHELAIVSASLDVYLEPIAERLGVGTVLCSRLEVNGAGLVTGNLVGGNCRAAEKLRRIRERFGEDGYELWAYGNSAGDAEMLAAADHPVWVGRRVGRLRLPTP